ncbi:MAG: DNA repair protein RecN [Anaerolineae bacterium]|jgi:DNA repair protein RecN (Recombination protein N)
MLTELHIHNFAIIDELHLSFGAGFTAFTGETGAGKSIIIDAVELVLGGRADTTAVREGADQALIEATFHLTPPFQEAIRPLLEQEGLEGDAPDYLMLSREVRAEGRSIARLNGRAVTLTLVREVVENLVDIHGQSDHLSLRRVGEHVNLLDRYADLWAPRSRVSALVSRIRAVRRERSELQRDEQALARRIDLLQYQIDEIEAAGLDPEEEKQLTEERVRLSNAEQLAELLGEALQALDEGDERRLAAIDLLGAAVRTLERLARIDVTLEPRLQDAEELSYRLQDLANALRDYQEQVEYNPRRLVEVEDRLNLIHRLERKYGSTIPEVLAYARQAQEDLEAITHSEERIAQLEAEEERLLVELGTAALALSAQRRQAAAELAEAIETELEDLRMAGTRLAVDFDWREDAAGVPLDQATVPNPDLQAAISDLRVPRVAFDSTGIDRVEFLVSPNPGEPLRPLARIASGGETSRLMLALKTVLSRADETPTLIFDEIDQGIGGRVGSTVGEKLWGLTLAAEEDAIPHQVLCITHLPQLAGFGDLHLKVDKEIVDDRTVTRVCAVTGDQRVEELAQMLGGGGEAARRSAREILKHVAQRKAQARDGVAK